MQPLKIIFAGTPEIAKITLDNLLLHGFNPALVLTQPDKPAGRGKQLSMSPVKQMALEHNIEVFQPQTFKDQANLNKIRELQPDLMVVIAYGIILPQALLDIPKLGCINIHVSLLPHLRGAAPIQRAILNGDQTSGVTIMQMDAGLDTGAILLQRRINIEAKETSGSLHDKLANLGAEMLIEYLHNYKQLRPHPQDNNLATYASKINKAEALIDFTESATIIARKIRGFNPVPGCFTFLEHNRLIIWAAEVMPHTTTKPPGSIIESTKDKLWIACGNNSVLQVTELQLAGRKRQTAQHFIQGYPNLAGETLTDS